MSTRHQTVPTILDVLRHAAVVGFLCPLPILWHEIAGHGVVGVLCGGKVTRFQLFGLQFVPDFRWTGTRGGLGICDHSGIRSQWCAHLTDIAGSMSTFVVAAVAAYVLWKCRPRGLKFTALICLAAWCTDLLTFTLPSFGVRRYIWSGTRYSEPYKAAVALGIPGALFQALVLVGAFAVFLLAGISIWRRIESARRA